MKFKFVSVKGKGQWLIFGAGVLMLGLSVLLIQYRSVWAQSDVKTTYATDWKAVTYQQFDPESGPDDGNDKTVLAKIDGWLVNSKVSENGTHKWDITENWYVTKDFRPNPRQGRVNESGQRFCRGKFTDEVALDIGGDFEKQGVWLGDYRRQQQVLATGDAIICTEENNLSSGMKVRGWTRSVVLSWSVGGTITPAGAPRGVAPPKPAKETVFESLENEE